MEKLEALGVKIEAEINKFLIGLQEYIEENPKSLTETNFELLSVINDFEKILVDLERISSLALDTKNLMEIKSARDVFDGISEKINIHNLQIKTKNSKLTRDDR